MNWCSLVLKPQELFLYQQWLVFMREENSLTMLMQLSVKNLVRYSLVSLIHQLIEGSFMAIFVTNMILL